MANREDVDKAFNAIVERQIKAVQEHGGEDNIQDDKDVETLLLNVVKEQIKMSLDNMYDLYDKFIDDDECSLKTALEYIPLFTVNGLINGAQLGVKQDEYYMIVDYYLKMYDLIA